LIDIDVLRDMQHDSVSVIDCYILLFSLAASVTNKFSPVQLNRHNI